MRSNIRDCFEQVIVLNRSLSSFSKLTLYGQNGYWGIYTKMNGGLKTVVNGLTTKEVSLYLDGIQWGLKNQ